MTHPLVGRWDIVAWVQDYDDGRSLHPLGEQLTGFIRYTDDGDMECLIARADRAAFTTGGQWDANESDRARAYSTMLAYAGRWTVESDHVLHHVEISLFPGWVGGTQRRRFVLDGDRAVLEARLEDGTSEARTARLVWRRHATASDVGPDSGHGR